MKWITHSFLVALIVATGQAFVHAEQVGFQLEDRPVVQLVEGEVRQAERILEWGFPMSIRYLGYRPQGDEFWWTSEGEWYQWQQRGSAWNGFIIASKEK